MQERLKKATHKAGAGARTQHIFSFKQNKFSKLMKQQKVEIASDKNS